MHGFDIIIHDHQKKIIKKKMNLNFSEEFNKKFTGKEHFSRIFRSELDILINHFYSDGIQFYGFFIDLVYLDKLNPNIWYDVHSSIEYYISDIGSRIDLVEFCYLSIELHKKNESKEEKNNLNDNGIVLLDNSRIDLPYLIGIIGVRSILGENNFLDNEIKKVFRSVYLHQNVKVERLSDLEKIKNYWSFVIKENNFRFHRFTSYGDHTNYNNYYGEISDLELIYSENDFDPGFAFGLDEWKYSKNYQVRGVKSRNPDSKKLIIYLLTLYLWHKNYKIYNNKIYKKIENSKYSWEIFDSIEYLKKNNLKILQYLKEKHTMQFKGINIIDIINKDWNKIVDEIILNNHYLNYIEINNDAIEFNDGIYIYTINKFFNFKFEHEFNISNLNCFFFLNYNFKELKKPKRWLNLISETISSKNLTSFCLDFMKILYPVNFLKCDYKPMLIYGNFDKGKVILVLDILVSFFNVKNIFFLNENDIFLYENLKDRKILVAHNNFFFKCYTNIRSLIIYDKKLPDNLEYERMYNCYEFNKLNNQIKNFNFSKKEIIEVIVYCNKLKFRNKKE